MSSKSIMEALAESKQRRLDREFDAAVVEAGGHTEGSIAKAIDEALRPHFGDMMFRVAAGPRLTNEVHLSVIYASVPKGSPEIDALNARSNPMLSIRAATGSTWDYKKPAPTKITVHHHRGQIGADRNYKSAVKFRGKTAAPDKIVKYIVDFFMKHKELLRSNVKP